MAHSETSRERVRSASAFVAALCSCLLLASGCSVYDESLLQQGVLADAGRAGGDIVINGGASSGGSPTSVNGGASAGAGRNGEAGEDSGSGGGTDSGGAGGTPTGTAGTSGGGEVIAGAPSGGAPPITGLSMIDDMENQDQYIPTTDKRVGYWSLSNDGTAGKQLPALMTMTTIPNGGRGTSLSALHTTSMGFTKTGALVSVDLNRKGATRASYDASAYKAIHFWARVEAGSATAVHVALLDNHTDPGGKLCCDSMTVCPSGSTYAKNGLCYDHFAKDITLTNTWAEYTITFEELAQVGWGLNNVDWLDAANVFNIQFNWGIASMDLWLDDIAFVKK